MSPAFYVSAGKRADALYGRASDDQFIFGGKIN